MKLKPHQIEGLAQMSNGKILGGGVGTGKTFTSLAYYVQKVCGGSIEDISIPMTRPRDLVVITTAKKRNDLDWEKDAVHLGLFRDPETSYGHQRFIVDSWNNIGKYQEMKGAFFIFDEQRLVGSGAWVKAFLKIAKENEWVLLSATPADSWMDYVPVFIANGFYRNRTDFIEQHVVYSFHGKYRKIRGFYHVKRLRQHRAQVLVDMPYERHTTRWVTEVEVEYDHELFDRIWKDRWNIYEDCPIVDVNEMYRLGRMLVNSHSSRLDAICELAAKHPRLIIFYSRTHELEALRTLHTRLDIPVAEYNGQKHEPVPDTERWLYLVQYTAGAEGWNCITTDAIVYHSLQYSHRVFEQTQGRTDRLNTPYTDLFYYVLKSNSKVDKRIWRALSTKQDFHEGRNEKF